VTSLACLAETAPEITGAEECSTPPLPVRSPRKDKGSEKPSAGVRVAMRIRPFLPREAGQREGVRTSERCVTVCDDRGQERSFSVDQLFDSRDVQQGASQRAVFDAVGTEMVQHALDGYNACLLAYGHTGSGKTYTMLGEDWTADRTGSGAVSTPRSSGDDGRGLLPRALECVFNALQQDSGAVCIASFYEVYNERIRDLIAPPPPAGTQSRPEESGFEGPGHGHERHNQDKRKRPAVHFHPRFGAFVSDATEVPCTTLYEALRLVWLGAQARTTAHTGLNDRSSRSHAVFVLRIERASTSNSLMIVDLAGREQERLTQCRSERFKELTLINRSLFHLSRCVRSLAAQGREQAAAPGAADKGGNGGATSSASQWHHFRNSKLTMLLGHALAGNSHTAVVGTISPARGAYEDSLATLRFCDGVKQVRTRPVHAASKREDVVLDLQDEVKRLELELLRARTGKTLVERQLGESQAMMEHYRHSWQSACECPHDEFGRQREEAQQEATAPQQVMVAVRPPVPPLYTLPLAAVRCPSPSATPSTPLPAFCRSPSEATTGGHLQTDSMSPPPTSSFPMEGLQLWGALSPPMTSAPPLGHVYLTPRSLHQATIATATASPSYLANHSAAGFVPTTSIAVSRQSSPPRATCQPPLPARRCTASSWDSAAYTSTTASEVSTPRLGASISSQARAAAAALLQGQTQQGGFVQDKPPKSVHDEDLISVVESWLDSADAGSPEQSSSRRANLVTTLNQLWEQLVEIRDQADKESTPSAANPVPAISASSWRSPTTPRTPTGSRNRFGSSASLPPAGEHSPRTHRDMRINAAVVNMLKTAGVTVSGVSSLVPPARGLSPSASWERRPHSGAQPADECAAALGALLRKAVRDPAAGEEWSSWLRRASSGAVPAHGSHDTWEKQQPAGPYAASPRRVAAPFQNSTSITAPTQSCRAASQVRAAIAAWQGTANDPRRLGSPPRAARGQWDSSWRGTVTTPRSAAPQSPTTSPPRPARGNLAWTPPQSPRAPVVRAGSATDLRQVTSGPSLRTAGTSPMPKMKLWQTLAAAHDSLGCASLGRSCPRLPSPVEVRALDMVGANVGTSVCVAAAGPIVTTTTWAPCPISVRSAVRSTESPAYTRSTTSSTSKLASPPISAATAVACGWHVGSDAPPAVSMVSPRRTSPKQLPMHSGNYSWSQPVGSQKRMACSERHLSPNDIRR